MRDPVGGGSRGVGESGSPGVRESGSPGEGDSCALGSSFLFEVS
jgi:hypothetical protein